jgi:hypothetical protein
MARTLGDDPNQVGSQITNLADERNRLFSLPFSVVMAQDAHGAHVRHRFVSPARSPSLGGA